MIPIHTTVYYMTVKKKDSWWGVPDCNDAPWFMQRVWSTDCTLGIWLWAPEGKTTLFPLFWEMRDRLMVCEMKKMRGVKKVRKCKVKGMACWSRSQGWGLRRWGGENFGGLTFKEKAFEDTETKDSICTQVIQLCWLFMPHATSTMLFTWLWRESLTDYE